MRAQASSTLHKSVCFHMADYKTANPKTGALLCAVTYNEENEVGAPYRNAWTIRTYDVSMKVWREKVVARKLAKDRGRRRRTRSGRGSSRSRSRRWGGSWWTRRQRGHIVLLSWFGRARRRVAATATTPTQGWRLRWRRRLKDEDCCVEEDKDEEEVVVEDDSFPVSHLVSL